MSDIISYNLEGADEIEKLLSELPTKLSFSLLKSFNRKAVKKYVVDPVRAAVPYSASTKKGIIITDDRNDKTKISGGVVSNKFWVRFVEKGTKQRVKGHNRGSITAKNIIAPIILNSVDDIINYSNKELGNELANFLQKRLKKMK